MWSARCSSRLCFCRRLYALARNWLCSGRAVRSCLRELMPSLVNTLRRCHSTVRALRNSCAPISGFDRPSRASRAICSSCGVSSSRVSTRALRAPSRPWRSARGVRARRTPPCRSRRTCRGPCAAARARRRVGPRGAATRRRADARGRAPDGAAYGSAARSPRGRGPRRRRRRSAGPGERASMPSAKSVPAGLRRLRQPLERIAREFRVCRARGRLDELGQRPHRDPRLEGVRGGLRGRRTAASS